MVEMIYKTWRMVMVQVVIYRLIIPVIFALITAVLIRKYLFFITLVSSYSMYPDLKPGDRIVTARIHRLNKIRRRDVVIFYSAELHGMMVKRVIGLPNEFIEIKEDGQVYINQKKFIEPYIKYPGTLTGTFVVPEKKYLFLGDNRADSNDSRLWSEPYISEKNIQGKAIFRIYPLRWANLTGIKIIA
jgi:signal peptidase I